MVPQQKLTVTYDIKWRPDEVFLIYPWDATVLSKQQQKHCPRHIGRLAQDKHQRSVNQLVRLGQKTKTKDQSISHSARLGHDQHEKPIDQLVRLDQHEYQNINQLISQTISRVAPKINQSINQTRSRLAPKINQSINQTRSRLALKNK